MNRYHENMRELNLLDPGIEPRASGHIIEQQQLIRKILDAGYAYEVNGSVYFDVTRYNESNHYGILSGRKIEDLLSNTRKLEGQSEKKNPLDFALWKKADPAHIMRWPSEWGEGYPGWHLECSAMSTKYLGMQFDIHGGGMDLLFPHHECEIAQNVAGYGQPSVRYWMHNNMITINGQKMGRSLGNFITLDQFFSGDNKELEKPYSPMTIRFFILQAHYRSTLDFSNEALQASEKGLLRLLSAAADIDTIKPGTSTTVPIDKLVSDCDSAMKDDMNTPVLIAHLFNGVKWISGLKLGRDSITPGDLDQLKSLYEKYLYAILGLRRPDSEVKGPEISHELIEMILQLRTDAKNNRDFNTADRIREELSGMGITIKDRKDGTDWEIH